MEPEEKLQYFIKRHHGSFKMQKLLEESIKTQNDPNIVWLEVEDGVSRRGAYEIKNGEYVWSFLNTMHTNYTIIEYLINISDFTLEQIWYEHSPYVKYFIKNILGKKVFHTSSEHYFKMFFMGQKTWNIGIISTLVFLFLLEKSKYKEIIFNFKRGDKDDIEKGVDVILRLMDNSIKKVQVKKTSYSINDNGDYVFKCNFNDEYTYLDWFAFDCQGKILIFKIKDGDIEAKSDGIYTILDKRLLIEEIKMTNRESTNLLLEIGDFCNKNTIPFTMDISDTESGNYIFNSGELLITIPKNYEDTIFEMLTKCYSELKSMYS